jgi:hypothetical protein
MRLRLLPQAGTVPILSWGERRYPLLPEHAGRGLHNMQLGEIRIIEHLCALMVALNLRLDADVSEPSFPTFDDCDATLVRAIEGVVRPGGPLRHFSVKQPVALVFERGYVLLEPASRMTDAACSPWTTRSATPAPRSASSASCST